MIGADHLTWPAFLQVVGASALGYCLGRLIDAGRRMLWKRRRAA